MSVKTIRNFQTNIVSVYSGPVSNIEHGICRSIQATSAETKCTLSSSLNIKSIKDVVINSNANGYNEFRIDTDVSVSGNGLYGNKLLHLEASGYLSSTSVTYFSSVKLPDINRVEALIPPSSCFQMKLTESITSLKIPFDDGGLSGYVVANVIGESSNEISPC